MNKRVVITGMGVVLPIGNGIDTFMDGMKKGRSGIRFIEELDKYNFSCKVGGVPDINDSEYFSILEKYSLTEADLSIQYAVLSAIEAWIDAGYDIPDFFDAQTQDDVGCIIGTSLGGTEIFVRKVYPLVNSGNVRRLGSQIIEHWMPSGSAASVSKILALANQTTANSSACATGTEAVIQGYKSIISGEARAMLVGGTEPYSPYCWAGFDSMRLLCRTYNHEPASASRPMSRTAGGFVPGAGAGILMIEELQSALDRNARIYAEIIGTAVNSGGQRMGGTMTAPNSQNVVKCVENAISDAGIEGKQINLISGHLTGTMADTIEIKNWIAALKIKKNLPYINSLKSIVGHLIGASGAVESIAAVLQLYHDFVHPNINCDDLHPDIQNIVPREKIPTACIEKPGLSYVIKASFGFGDVNSCIVFKKFS